jgi:hypothetical protein
VAGVFGVHVEAEGASVDLGSAGFYQFEKRRLETASANIRFEPSHGFVGSGDERHNIGTLGHNFILND